MSNDPVLQTRVLAYADTQRYRLGVNYQLLPVSLALGINCRSHFQGALVLVILDNLETLLARQGRLSPEVQQDIAQCLRREYICR